MSKIPNFVHLHTHTDSSPDGLGTVDKLVDRAVELGFSSLAMTDHGTLANTITFWSECQRVGIKPILGLEGYMLWNGNRHHITLNALNKVGFENLVRLNNVSHENYQNSRPLMTIDMMDKYSAGIAAFTGCPASPIHHGSYNDGLVWAGTMSEIYKKRFYGELMFVMDEDVVNRPLKISKELGLPILVTNDVHYPFQNQHKAHKIMTECRKGYSYNSERLWMRSPLEMLTAGTSLFDEGDVASWMNNAYEFGESVEKWDIYSKPNLPEAKAIVADFYNSLESSYWADVEHKAPEQSAICRDRYNYELKILEDADFIDYFAILYDIVKFAKSKDIPIGPGRGSAASSYLLYILGVTGIDPIVHELPFERFMNPMRKEYPDVDLDFCAYRRHEVIEYAAKRWGAFPIATYSHYSHKALVNDLGRNLKIDGDLTKLAGEKGPDSDEFNKFISSNPDAKIAYESMEGQVRHSGKHAGGIIITDQVVPIENIGGTLVAAWTEGYAKQLSKAGVVKFDILAVLALTQIDMMQKMTGLKEFRPNPEDHPDVFRVFQDGDVLGIFQWTGSDGIRNLTMRIAPSTFYDLTVINSLYRPGALDAGTAEIYPDLIKNPRKIHPKVDGILEKTNGAIVFQEQVMGIIQTVVGGTLSEADLARRLIFKPRPGQIEWENAVKQMHEDFFTKGEDNGIDKKSLALLWSEIMTHSRYSFNLAHAASYSLLAFEMAYFKLYHPTVFYAVMMSTDVGNIQSYMIEATLKEIEFLPPHINSPFGDFTIEGKCIRMPLSIVGSLSSNSAEAIRNNYEEKGPFKSYADFDDRITGRQCTQKAIKYLWWLGAFDGVDGELTDIKRFKELPESVTRVEAQMDALGFVIPNMAVAKLISTASDDYAAVGYVKGWKDKVNKRGNTYRVYSLAPYGSFWIRDEDKMNKIVKGMLVKAEKNKWGMASSITSLKVK
jgi:DNA polymerase-3 subunit alpha